MASNTLSIIEEFLRSGEPQIRRNAITALAVMNDQDSVRLIIDTALKDPDAGVRRRAEEEILLLDEESQAGVTEALMESLKSKDSQSQQLAYAFLARLKSRGMTLTNVWLPWGSRMRLASSMNLHVYPARKWSYRLRGFRPGLLGTLAGLIFFVPYVLNVLRPHESWTSFIRFIVATLTILLVGTLLAIFATQYTTPINLQLNRRTALLVEVLITTVCVIVGMYFFYLLISKILQDSPTLRANGVDSLNQLLLPLHLGLMAGAVRAGTIIAFGRFKVSRHFRSKSLNWVIQVASGILVGFSVMTIILLIYSLGNSPIPLDVRIAAWLSFLATAVGLASAFANVDGEAPPQLPVKDVSKQSP